MNLTYLKLVTGEEVIGYWKGCNEQGNISLINPKVITLIPTSQGGTNVTLIPLMWAAVIDGVVKIMHHAILARTEVGEDRWEKMYLQSTSRLDLTSKLST